MIYSYRRVSTDEQHNGPQAQSDAIERWASNYLAALPPTGVLDTRDFFDNGVSGSVPLFEREEGAKLGQCIEQDKVPPTVVVAKLDRMFRSVADAATTIAHWDKIGVKLVSVSEGFDMTSPYGRAMCQMASVFAELEREMIRSRTKAALASKKARGECVGEIPYGWDKVGDVLKENVGEQGTLAMIRQMHDQGHMSIDIRDALNRQTIPAKKGGKWSTTQIRRILNRAF